ncbi:hypothetical protein ONS95_014940 [Cadophora gregata]|uniref:uncharacterized protein n=1 Tax=Cadophora gregata TaxID=51156 RepID=UPI0026DAA4C1|nr:uncharacterized protein ONS95_014940 [Cadophora gregata]KAK0103140.1 hypothetical protein ONS96_005749 [Cadophora gregata f. sp. sojae]KAK0113244.1 hypothetical protein ONS95_014940 [Cadophora gregata]
MHSRANNTRSTYNDGTVTHRKPSLLDRLLRTFQFLSSLTSLIVFSIRLRKIISLAGRATRSNGAVEGILAAAVLYTLIAMALKFAIKGTGSNMLRIVFIVLDLLFVGAFTAVAVLTSPKRHGSSAPCNATRYTAINTKIPSSVNCNLPWGTFILAIVSTLLHAATAAYHVIKDKRRTKTHNTLAAKEVHQDGHLNENRHHGHNNV